MNNDSGEIAPIPVPIRVLGILIMTCMLQQFLRRLRTLSQSIRRFIRPRFAEASYRLRQVRLGVVEFPEIPVEASVLLIRPMVVWRPTRYADTFAWQGYCQHG